MQALLNSGDEMLVPAPDYPLWTAAVSLSSGKAVHYLCDESSDWFPDLDDIRAKITPRTRGIVIINPNNPTGAVYSKELLQEIVEIARQHNLIIFADEIYDKILYDDAEHHSIAALAPDMLTVTFNGLSKTYRVAGFRQAGWCLTGRKARQRLYRRAGNAGLDAPVRQRPGATRNQTALGGYQSISEFIIPGGRLYEQRNRAWELINGSRASPASSRKARCICSRKSTPNALISTMTRKWCSTSFYRRKCCWFRAPPLTGRGRITCVSSPCRVKMTGNGDFPLAVSSPAIISFNRAAAGIRRRHNGT